MEPGEEIAYPNLSGGLTFRVIPHSLYFVQEIG